MNRPSNALARDELRHKAMSELSEILDKLDGASTDLVGLRRLIDLLEQLGLPRQLFVPSKKHWLRHAKGNMSYETYVELKLEAFNRSIDPTT